jgi:hypothetical protein
MRLVLPLLVLFALPGCRLLERTRTAADLLGKPRMSRESVTLETFSVRLPRDDAARYESIWREVDEHKLPAELRARLAENGFRAGIVGGQLPGVVQELLAVRAQQPQTATTQPATA